MQGNDDVAMTRVLPLLGSKHMATLQLLREGFTNMQLWNTAGLLHCT